MKNVTRALKIQILVLGGFLLLCWILETVDSFVLQQWLNHFGIVPRTKDGLWGILWMPFLHGGFPHLVANTVPFALFGWLIFTRGWKQFLGVTVIASVVGGLGVWLFGAPNSVHIGASLLIYGYLGFLMAAGFFERKPLSIIISLVVGYFFWRALAGVLPGQVGISWEGHLFGFLGGVTAAKLLASKEPEGRK
ncbi:MAG: rhomboid family intramembrane serine protease [Candidatus Xenobia bacterium]|jgi:membrane associated rhomboid family serine protease